MASPWLGFISLLLLWVCCTAAKERCDHTELFINNKFLSRYVISRSIEGTTISYSCDNEYYPANENATATCTKDGWSPPPRCVTLAEIRPPACKNFDPLNGFLLYQKYYLSLNEKVAYGCRSGFATLEGRKTGETQCLEEGWRPEPKCVKTCLKPNEENAVFDTTKTTFISNETLHYICKDGFETVKRTTGDHIQCTGNGWDPSPLCLPIECEGLVLENGTVEDRQNKYVNGDVVRFSCSRGYMRVGPDSAQCYHFGWSPQPPICKAKVKPCEQPIASIPHGSADGELHEEYQHGEKVAYECDVGFAMTGPNTIECVDGEWTSLPSCTELCPPPPELPNAVNVTEVRNYRSGEAISFECVDNFVLQGLQKIICEGGRWKTPPRCVETKCGDPPSIPHGEAKSGASKRYVPGEIVEYLCHEGFEVDGPRTAICENMGWSQLPSCKEKSCQKPPTIFNASYRNRVKSLYDPGETVDYDCHPGFAAEGPRTITCRRGEWSQPSNCEDVACRETPVVDNADIEEERAEFYLPGQELHYQCHEGFEISGSDTIRCENNKWSILPRCEDVTCPPPPVIPNGHIDGCRKERYLPLEKVSYQCLGSNNLLGPSTAMCLKKEWINVPECRAAGGKCNHPPAIENGDILEMPKYEYMPGEKVHYKCQNLYRMEGNVEIICHNGQWTEPPTCIDAACREPPVVDNADIVEERMESYVPGHELHYQCHKGFEISGLDTIRCENKEWSALPKCEDVRCPPPPAIPNGRINGYPNSRYFPLEKVRYRCFPPYIRFGSSSVMCLRKEWTRLPECRAAEERCDRPPSIENGDTLEMPKSEYMLGEKVHYKCQNLYRMEGNADVICYNGHWTELPTCIVPCTAIEEDMKRNNIQLKWSDSKVYAEPGDTAEFNCRWGYYPDPDSPPFRVPCVDGRFEYPRCVRRIAWQSFPAAPNP